MKSLEQGAHYEEGDYLTQEVCNILDDKRNELSGLKENIELGKPKELQMMLKHLGFYDGAIDGVLGKDMKKAVEIFQEQYGLSVDGIIGPKTRSMLYIQYANYLNQQPNAYTWGVNTNTPALWAPIYSTSTIEQPIGKSIIEKKYGIHVSVAHRYPFMRQTSIDMEQQLNQLDEILNDIPLDEKDKRLLQIHLIYDNEVRITSRDEKKPYNETTLKLCIPCTYSSIQKREALTLLINKARLAYDVLPHGYSNMIESVNYDSFLEDPAVDFAAQIPDSWITPIGNVYVNEVKLWVGRSLYLNGEEKVTKERVEKHLQAILETRKQYEKTALFHKRNVTVLVGDYNLDDTNNSRTMFSPDERKGIDMQKPDNVSVLTVNKAGLKIKEQFKDKIVTTPSPATFYISAHGGGSTLYLEGKPDITISEEELRTWFIERYKRFPELLNTPKEQQDIIIMNSCKVHNFSRLIHSNLRKQYGNKTFPIIISAGEYGQLTFGGFITDHTTKKDYASVYEWRTLLEDGIKLDLGDVFHNDQWSRGLNSFSVYVPLTAKTQQLLEQQNVPPIHIQQLTDNLEQNNKTNRRLRG